MPLHMAIIWMVVNTECVRFSAWTPHMCVRLCFSSALWKWEFFFFFILMAARGARSDAYSLQISLKIKENNIIHGAWNTRARLLTCIKHQTDIRRIATLIFEWNISSNNSSSSGSFTMSNSADPNRVSNTHKQNQNFWGRMRKCNNTWVQVICALRNKFFVRHVGGGGGSR